MTSLPRRLSAWGVRVMSGGSPQTKSAAALVRLRVVTLMGKDPALLRYQMRTAATASSTIALQVHRYVWAHRAALAAFLKTRRLAACLGRRVVTLMGRVLELLL